MIRIMFCLTLLLLFIACGDDEQPANPIVAPQSNPTTSPYTDSQNQKIENIEHVVADLMQEWQQIKTDLDAGIMPDIDSLKTSVDTLLNDLGTIQQELEKLTTLINASGGDPTPSDGVEPPKVDMPPTIVPSSIFASEIVFQSEGNLHSYEIYKINSDGTNRQQLTFRHGERPKWAPDGKQIAFTSLRFQQRSHLFTMNPDGSNQRLTQDPEDLDHRGGIGEWFDWLGPDVFIYGSGGYIYINGIRQERLIRVGPIPAVSPDGQIAFVRDHPFDDPQVYITVPFGGSLEPLIGFDKHIENPAFSPNGAFIAFDNGSNIFVANANDGTQRTQLTMNPTIDRQEAPTWSPDGRQIAFAGHVAPDWNWEIYVINNDGTNRRNITNTPGANERFPDWRPH